jgi:H+/Cl- antiporter ClcA
MKLRRTMFVLLLILSGLVTILVFWLAVRIEQIYAELACTPLAEFEGYCEPQNAHPNPWILGLIVVVGTVVMASFGWLAWQARGGGRPERPARPHPERPQPD